MFITKININLDNHENLRGYTDIGYFHSKIEKCFHGGRQHPLWALDNNTNILMLSNEIPDVPEDFGSSLTKEYDPHIAEGTILNYKITANPIVDKNGKRVPLNLHRTKNQPVCATDWLEKRMQNNGAKTIFCNITKHETIKAKFNTVAFLSVTYEGQLQVTDHEQFDHLLRHGIGHEKAYGCGLLLVKPC